MSVIIVDIKVACATRLIDLIADRDLFTASASPHFTATTKMSALPSPAAPPSGAPKRGRGRPPKAAGPAPLPPKIPNAQGKIDGYHTWLMEFDAEYEYIVDEAKKVRETAGDLATSATSGMTMEEIEKEVAELTDVCL